MCVHVFLLPCKIELKKDQGLLLGHFYNLDRIVNLTARQPPEVSCAWMLCVPARLSKGGTVWWLYLVPVWHCAK